MIKFKKDTTSNFEVAITKEWLETNGLGGYASSTIIGTNTRKYHGLLVAAIAPPTKRFVYLAKLEETLIIGKERFDLSCNQYQGVIHPDGYKYLEEFRLDPFPVFRYRIDGLVVEKSVFMVHGENATVVTYELMNCPYGAVALYVRPLIACRGYHNVSYENQFFSTRIEDKDGIIKMKPYEDYPALYLMHHSDQVEHTAYWYRNFEYKVEYDRGLESYEDLYSPGHFIYLLREGETSGLVASLKEGIHDPIRTLKGKETIRQKELMQVKGLEDDFAKALVKSSGDFIVKRDKHLTSVIAGYHWFTDWGRDTFVSLPGLTLVNGNYEAARSVLSSWAGFVERGLMPSRFPDDSERPEYNSIDASLWFFYAVGKYLDYTHDLAFVKKHVLDTLLEILDYYVRGTRYGIKMDDDGLIFFDERNVPLTWMDVAIEGAAVTPRYGKVVEVNALWYNAIKVTESIIGELDVKLKREYGKLAELIKKNYNELFWYEDGGYLYDYVDGSVKDASIRPNQIFAISLPHQVLLKPKAKKALDVVGRELLTQYGLRSLSMHDKKYEGFYQGDQYVRDRAYHQGTAWSHLMGPFITAYLRVNGRTKKSLDEVEGFLAPFRKHINDAGLGTISEIFDGDGPQRPNGCISQAWSVAEILRAYAEDILALSPAEKQTHHI